MVKRGVRDWNGDDLFDPEPPPAPIPVAAPAPVRACPTDADCRRMERALERFKVWFLHASLAQLEAAVPAKLAAQYPPITAPDIEQMIAVRIPAVARGKAVT